MSTPLSYTAAPCQFRADNAQAALIMVMAIASETQKETSNSNLNLNNKMSALDVTIVNGTLNDQGQTNSDGLVSMIDQSYDAQAANWAADAAGSFAAAGTAFASFGLSASSLAYSGGDKAEMINDLQSLKSEASSVQGNGAALDLDAEFKNSIARSGGYDAEGNTLKLEQDYVVDQGKLRLAEANENGSKLKDLLEAADDSTKTTFFDAIKDRIKSLGDQIGEKKEYIKKAGDATHSIGQAASQGYSSAIKQGNTATQKIAEETRAKLDNAKSMTEQTQQSNQTTAKDSLDKMNAAFELARLAEGINTIRG